ncbi:hypothetical protein F0249_10510 [Vibrio sp. 03-59-1]|uniref:hypothetical protein n=1 Tax=Vibrio sp. 03-59-1 TaxID=2607607 RepID=UPI00149387DE|nr:hypothetical protein [Vibrio sp. 03-59-1]NOH84246.1 hypothetical protein [Vibrio sp. 03-59-1]
MKQPTKINSDMFNLLIEKEMNNFTVIEARDAFALTNNRFEKIDDARKYVYRQILSFERKGWISSKGSGRKKRYSKTTLFLQNSFAPRGSKKRSRNLIEMIQVGADFPLNKLVAEKNQHEGELAIILGEVEEYQLLMERFPHLKESFMPLFSEAKDRSAKRLGKINALSNILKVVSSRTVTC